MFLEMEVYAMNRKLPCTVLVLLVIGQMLFATSPNVNPATAQLFEAALRGTKQQVFRAFANGADISQVDEKGLTALAIAAKFNKDAEVTKALVDLGADIEVRSPVGTTPLIQAAYFNTNEAVISVLLDAGADVKVRNNSGITALHAAAMNNTNPKIMKLLLEKGSDITNIAADGKTPLEEAVALNKNLEVIKLLSDWIAGHSEEKKVTKQVSLSGFTLDDWNSAGMEEVVLQVSTHSGSPLLLKITIEDPQETLCGVSLATASSQLSVSLEKGSTHEIVASPFSKSGVYELQITLTSIDLSVSKTIEVAFSDFVWGRDNYSFNNELYNNTSIYPYSPGLFRWAENRFGLIDEMQSIILLNQVYEIGGGALGRCYAYSAGQVYYKQHPEKLPSYYKNTYGIMQTNLEIQQRMDMLQNDILFDKFLVEGYDTQMKQTLDELCTEFGAIRATIDRGEPAIIGYVTEEEHHSFLVYGYFWDADNDLVTLVAANNWENGQTENLASKDAVLIHLDLSSESGPGITWSDTKVPSYKVAHHLFSVDLKDVYADESALIRFFVDEELAKLKQSNKMLVIVEEASSAYFKDNDARLSGMRKDNQTVEAIPGVTFSHSSQSYIVTLSSSFSGSLEIVPFIADRSDKDWRNMLVYVLAPSNGASTSFKSYAFSFDKECPDDDLMILLFDGSQNIRVGEGR